MTVQAHDHLIVALDYPGATAALNLVDRLGERCRWYKVGLELYLAAGPDVITALRQRGKSIFLDLKLHDIPNTVAGAVRSISSSGAELLTVHAAGGPDMLRQAQKAASESPNAPRLLAVSVLTSMDQAALAATGVSATPPEQVVRLATLAAEAGLPGMVCSAEEVAALRRLLGPATTLVVPGIRPETHVPGSDDQRRTATPAEALRAGASMLVVGRPVTQAQDPVAACEAILHEMQAELQTAPAASLL